MIHDIKTAKYIPTGNGLIQAPGLYFQKGLFVERLYEISWVSLKLESKEKKNKNYIVPYRFSDLFYFEFEGNFSPSISSRGLIFRGGEGLIFGTSP